MKSARWRVEGWRFAACFWGSGWSWNARGQCIEHSVALCSATVLGVEARAIERAKIEKRDGPSVA